MVVLHIVAPAGVGGLERVVEMLAAGHARSGERVVVACIVEPGPDEPSLLQKLRTQGVEVEPVQVRGRRYLRERSAVRALVRSVHPDVVHTHGYRPDVVDAGVARQLGRATITTVHGFTGGGWKNRLYERLQVRHFRRFEAVVAVSRPLAAQLAAAGVPPARIHLLPNAWVAREAPLARSEARRMLGVPQSGPCIGWVGRFTPEKGPDLFLRALARLSDVPATGAMLGAGPDLDATRREAARLGVGGRIAWPGLVPDAGRLLTAFDVLVLSSRTEGTPIVLFEAMAAGVPVVATSVGGVPDVVTPAEAVLVPPEDPDALAAGARAVLAEPAQARSRADAAARKLESEFAPTPWLKRYTEVYAEAVEVARARHWLAN